MPKKAPRGRPKGSKNLKCDALPVTEALAELEARTTQTPAQTARILGTTLGAVYREIRAGNLPALEMGKLRLVPSAAIRSRILAS